MPQAQANGPQIRSRLRSFHVRLYSVGEFASEILIYFILVASPWLFGTTQEWSMRMMNAVGFILGGLLAFKLFVRNFRDYHPARWAHPEENLWLRRTTRLLAIVTLIFLGYCLVSGWNYRGIWQRTTNTFEYQPYISWLPHSYDRASTFRVFWNYLAMACVFWAICDWLLGASLSELQTGRSLQRGAGRSTDIVSFFPVRIRRLLWVLSVNGGLLAIEGIVQRLSGSDKLLWLVQPLVHKDALSQFGPYAYRSNAAQYFNLLWPAVLGFWWTLHRSHGFRRWRHHWLLACGVVMAACPIIATTRGGALVTGGLIFSSALFLLLSPLFFRSRGRFSPRTALITGGLVAAFFGTALWLGVHFGWAALEPRMTEIEEGYEAREHTYETARQMARDYPLFGTGPGTFDPLFQLYRASTEEFWPAQLHNDWLETRITFGLLGMGLILLALSLVIARWFVPGGIHGGRRFVVLVWMGFAGCLVHARFDFPFQIYSIILLFLALCAVLFTLSKEGKAK
jgi:O-antigen ligase